jgi:ABC-type antimicrobial peptide transport system permease subunit
MNLPLLGVRTQQEQIDANREQPRLFATLTSGFGLPALVLACVGIYGLLAYSVTRRTHEIGIRMALGTQGRQILKLIFRESSLLVLAGIVCGCAAALACSQLVKSMLYGLKAADPVAAIAAAGLLLVVALTATRIPARRASRVDPMRALRHE